MNYLSIPGWFTFSDVYDLAAERYGQGTLVEVGAWLGASTAYLAARVPRLYVVDTWRGSCGTDLRSDGCMRPVLEANNGDVYSVFVDNMTACGVHARIVPMRMLSVEAAACFQDSSVDFCYLDAAHDLESIRADIRAWLPKIRPGGLLAGHDYDDVCPGVVQAVTEAFGKDVKFMGWNSWLYWRRNSE